MLVTITILIAFLVVLNFLLLKFSVNKSVKPSNFNKKPVVLNPEITTEFEAEELAPTGS